MAPKHKDMINSFCQSITNAKTKGMLHQAKVCLEDTSPDQIILHHGTIDLRSNDTP